MSLICVMCGKIIVMSNNPTHYGVCSGSDCNPKDLTKEQEDKVSKGFKVEDD